ncbi:hypothetical protein N7540_010977 [Penicillium herquei]|nr:hypothetical protein N7540_010977 [Penicillium herquei]
MDSKASEPETPPTCTESQDDEKADKAEHHYHSSKNLTKGEVEKASQSNLVDGDIPQIQKQDQTSLYGQNRGRNL